MDHTERLLDFLVDEVLSSGGDGDAIWYVRDKSLDFMKELCEQYAREKSLSWRVDWDKGCNYLNFGDGQEWITITISRQVFNSRPSWQQISVEC